jgi:hypothetical protein
MFCGAQRRGEKHQYFAARSAAAKNTKINNIMECACWNVGPGRQMEAGSIDFWIKMEWNVLPGWPARFRNSIIIDLSSVHFSEVFCTYSQPRPGLRNERSSASSPVGLDRLRLRVRTVACALPCHPDKAMGRPHLRRDERSRRSA